MTDTQTGSKPPVTEYVGTVQSGLRGNMGVLGLILIAVAFNGPMVVFTGFIPMITAFGNGIGAPLTFVTLGALVIIFAVGLNSMARFMHQPGAFYSYISKGLGRVSGLASGSIAMVAYVTFGAGTYALLGISVDLVLTSVFGLVTGMAWWVWAIIGWAIGTFLSMLNVDVSAKVLGIAATLEILIVVAWDIAVFTRGGPEGRSFDVIGEYFSGSLTWAFVFGVLTLVGFESLQVFRSETKDPKRTAPRATYIFLVTVTLLYATTAYAYLVAFGPSQGAALASDDPQSAVLSGVTLFMGPLFADIAIVLLMTSSFAACLSIQNVASRYVFQFGKDGIIPARFGHANERHGSPMFASLAVSLIMLALFGGAALFGHDGVKTWANLSGTGSLGILLLWTATSVAVIVYFARRRHREVNIFARIVFPAISAIAFLIITVLTVLSFTDVVGDEQTAALALWIIGLLIIGSIAYGLWLRKSRPSIYKRIGALDVT